MRESLKGQLGKVIWKEQRKANKSNNLRKKGVVTLQKIGDWV